MGMAKIVIIGGGWAGCAAAITAKKAGGDVHLFERTDMLLGLGNVGGIIRNNGRYTAAEETMLLGAAELFEITDRCSRHKNLDFPGHKHCSLYDVAIIEAQVRKLIKTMGNGCS
jgi:glycine/D-amino acid oxidase-like deaminating enzyme